MVLVRGDHRLNEIKLANHLGAPFRPARAEEIEAEIGPAGFIGPVGAGVPVLMDDAISGAGLVAGANRPDAHLIGVEPGRDFEYERCDVRAVEAGDTTEAGGTIEIEPAIEVGNIFKLGTTLLGAARRHLPGRVRHRAPDRDGQLRDRPGADRRRRDRAGRRREGNRLAAADRPVGRARGRARKGRRRGGRTRRAPPTRRCARRGSRRCSTTAAGPERARSSPTPS